jgi:DNA-binding IclR family transcriptional regulator
VVVGQGEVVGGPYVEVIGKAVALLDTLLAARDELSLAELSRDLRMSRTTVHRLLATLERHALVERTDRNRYRLGLHLFVLGLAVQDRLALARVARPHLRALAETHRVSSYLSVPDGDAALCLDRFDGGGVSLSAYQVGETLPLHVGAGPLALLASLDDAEVSRVLAMPLTRPPAETIADPAAIRARIGGVRESGIAWASGDLEVGVIAVGAPVRDPDGRTIAAVSAAGLTQQLTERRRADLELAVRQAAAAIGTALTRSSGGDRRTTRGR